MSNLIGKKFEYNLMKGEIKTVKEIRNDLVIFEDDGRVPVERFTELFTEVSSSNNEAKRVLFNNDEVDPISFFDNSSHNQLLEKLKKEAENIDLNKTPVQHVDTKSMVDSRVEEPAVKRIFIETDEKTGKITSKEEHLPGTSSDFFKKMKRNQDIKINVQFTQRIPNIDFIKMMDENFDQGVMEYLISEITEEVLASPQIIQTQIRKQLEDLLAKKDSNKKKKNVKSTD
jgi:hypothetical protein